MTGIQSAFADARRMPKVQNYRSHDANHDYTATNPQSQVAYIMQLFSLIFSVGRNTEMKMFAFNLFKKHTIEMSIAAI